MSDELWKQVTRIGGSVSEVSDKARRDLLESLDDMEIMVLVHAGHLALSDERALFVLAESTDVDDDEVESLKEKLGRVL